MWGNIVYIFYLIGSYILFKFIFKIPDFVIYYSKFSFYIMYTQIVTVLVLPIMALRPRDVIGNGLLFAYIMKPISTVLGVTWQLRNGEVLADDRGAVIVVNHQSSLDILGLYSVMHVLKQVAPVCRKEVLYLFPYGFALYMMGCIFIDRKKPQDAHNILKASADVIFKNKIKIWIFPEGTRNKHSIKMQPFKKGAFTLAISRQAPIIPLVISPYYFLDAKKHIFKKGTAIMQCLDAISTEGLTMDDLPELKDRVQNMMEQTYVELGKKFNSNVVD